MIPLTLNTAQRYVYNKIQELRKKKKAARLIILKSRQLGISTFLEAVIFALASQQPNRNALIMADIVDKSNYLFEMSKLYQEKLVEKQPHLSTPLKKSNEKKLEWQGLHSQILIDTAQNIDATRAYTYQYVHLSESAFFPDLPGVLQGLQGVPDNWDTLIALETTANGYGNEFHQLWQTASKGKNEYIPIFLAWFIQDEYSLPLPSGKLYPLDGVEFDTDNGIRDFLVEENALKAKYNLTDAQLNWRRYAIVNKCAGKVSSFRQEYPSNPDEAFLSTGGCVFDTRKLKRQKERAGKPLVIGNLVVLDNKIVLRPDSQGAFRLWEKPESWMRFVIGADTAEGIGKDASAAVALDRVSGDTVLTYHSNVVDTDQFAVDLAKMGRYLNQSIIAPESFPSATGYSVTHDLAKIYGNVYKNIIEDEVTKQRTEKIGFYNNKKTRQQAIDQFIEEIREDGTQLRDPELIDECLSFVQDPETGKIAAQTGCHDDMVMARVIAGKLRQLYPLAAYPRSVDSGDYGKNKPKPKPEPMTTWSK